MKRYINDDQYGSVGHIFDDIKISKNRLIFIHNIFFRAAWATQFDASLTEKDIFYDDSGFPYIVKMMNQKTNSKLFDSHQHNFRILFKDFTHPFLFAAIVLPNDGISIEHVLKTFKVFVAIYTD
ncbi:hypothetical protein RF11_14712 [Thelohanellus kitauei]|uniref:Serpin domain-containing protein n=1 Tax=Thelohanellus kitauei TaxID=669202 RepID=A0A0C2IWK3_THEKT|nr:hypothetical protein RF11_14712 [Thelohanellus kitauei]